MKGRILFQDYQEGGLRVPNTKADPLLCLASKILQVPTIIFHFQITPLLTEFLASSAKPFG